MQVFAPGTSELPIVILFHGGGWIGGAPADIAPFASRLSEDGFVVFNAPYRLALRGGGFPESIEDAACAVAVAREAGETLGGNSDLIIAAGFSAGAHLAAVAALAGDEFGGDCLASEPRLPNGFVGLSGAYDTDSLGLLMVPFFGTNRSDDPEPWIQGNPFTHIGKNPSLRVGIVAGSRDPIWPMSERFDDALAEAGYSSFYTLLDGVSHTGVLSRPEALEAFRVAAQG